MRPKPSDYGVVIPALNAAPWIGRAIRSAHDQCLPPAQIVLVDNGSTDDTVACAQKVGGESLLVLSESAPGGNPARNRGWRALTTPWIIFLDADDELLPSHAGTLLSHALNVSADVVYSPSIVRHHDNPELDEPLPASYDAEDPIASWLANTGFQTGAVLWSRETLVALDGWTADLPCCQDYEIIARALRGPYHLSGVNRPGAIYHLHPGPSLSRRSPLKVIRQSVNLITDLLRWLESGDRLEQHYQALGSRRLFDLLWEAALHDPAWAATTFARLNREEAFTLRLDGPRREALVKLLGWRLATRMRGVFGQSR